MSDGRSGREPKSGPEGATQKNFYSHLQMPRLLAGLHTGPKLIEFLL